MLCDTLHLDVLLLLSYASLTLYRLCNLYCACRYEYKRVEHRRTSTLSAEAAAALAAAAASPLLLPPIPGGALGAPRGSAAAAALAARIKKQVQAQQVHGALGMPGGGRPATAVAIAGRMAGRGRGGSDEDGEDEVPLDIYGRSLAYVPPSPAMPAPFR